MTGDGNHRSAESCRAAVIKRYLGQPWGFFIEIERRGQNRARNR